MSSPTLAPTISKLTLLKDRKRGAYQHLILSRHLFLLRREPEGYRTTHYPRRPRMEKRPQETRPEAARCLSSDDLFSPTNVRFGQKPT